MENIFIEDSSETVLQVAETYNKDSRRAANKKWIEIGSINLDKDTISFVLASDSWLQFPTKAIKGFISMLAKYEPYKSLITPSGRLFKGEFEFIEDEVVEEQELSDEETLLEVTKLFFRQTEENRRKIDAIKQVLGGNCYVDKK